MSAFSFVAGFFCGAAAVLLVTIVALWVLDQAFKSDNEGSEYP